MTGNDLLLTIVAEAGRRGVTPKALIADLSPNPDTWLRQLAVAERPRQHTIDRVNALLRGEPVPPAPENNFQRRSYQLSARTAAVGPDRDPPADAPRVYREPCFRCGVRGDIGCAHQPLTGDRA